MYAAKAQRAWLAKFAVITVVVAFIFAVRPIDLAIFGTLGSLWIGGAVFIFVLYRWIRRYEREQDPTGPDAVEVALSTHSPRRARVIANDAGARPLADPI